METLQERDGEGLRRLLEIVFNSSMKAERETALQAAPYPDFSVFKAI